MTGRVHYLDGVRGWAALAVLLYHAYWECFGVLFPEFKHGALALLCNGPLAVSVFFVLSGDALLTPFLASRNIEVLRTTSFRRYTRLSTPIALACLLSFGAMKLGWLANAEAARVVHREDWLGSFLQFQPSFAFLVKYVSYGVYFDTAEPRAYIPFLWTMSIEMLGSALIFLFGLQMERLKSPARVALFIALVLYACKSYYALFFLGAWFSILRARGVLPRQPNWGTRGLSLSLLAMAFWSCARSPDIGSDSLWMNAARAAAIMGAVHLNGDLIALMSSRLSRFMGQISFALYLVHFVVLVTLTSHLILMAHADGSLTQGEALGIFALTVVVSMLAAWLFARVETWCLSHVNRALERLRWAPGESPRGSTP